MFAWSSYYYRMTMINMLSITNDVIVTNDQKYNGAIIPSSKSYMIMFHSSPVLTRRSVIIAFPKFLKFV